MPIAGLTIARWNSDILRRAARLRLAEGQWKQKVSKAGTRVFLENTVLFSPCLGEQLPGGQMSKILSIRTAFGAAHRRIEWYSTPAVLHQTFSEGIF